MPVTLFYSSLCGVLLIGLSTYVSLARGRHKAGIGQVPAEILRPVRAHGNAAENMPIAMILLGALELSGTPVTWLHVLGATFIFGRLLHAISFLFRVRGSGPGVTLNHLVIFAMSVLGIIRFFVG